MITRKKRAPLERKILTLYGERGSLPNDPEDSAGFPRGIAVLNGVVHDLQRKNPDVTIHSVSHSTIIYPDPQGRHSASVVWLLCTLVYSGTIRPEDIDDLAIQDGHGGTPRDLEEGDYAYSTVVSIQL